jgi:tRNA(Ile)-lysidine synthase
MGSRPHPFVRAVSQAGAARSLFPEGARVLVALSGGPDSSALLIALCEAAEAALLPCRPVAAAHFHHGLRGSDADGDAGFSAALSAGLGVPCVVGLGAVSAGSGRSPNDAARRDRYAFLVETAREVGADHIATAHTADDQAETVLGRVLRGTSMEGVAGIATRREREPGLWVVRPLLGLRRAEGLAFLAERGVVARHDPSNDKDR